ncbi:hypothetical protein [Bradyrhizobium sp. USDA 4486]
MRIRVGRLIALAYLFCVLAPAASLAWGTGPAPCLGDDVVLADLVTAHHQMQDGHIMHGGVPHDRAGSHPHHQATADAPTPHQHDGKGQVGPCSAR